MKKIKLAVEIGKVVTLTCGQTTVTGVCSGLRVDADMELESVWVEGFQYNGFTIGELSRYWQVSN
jgi:hypothetical protein